MGWWNRLTGITQSDAPAVQAYGAEGAFYDINDPRVIDFLRDGNATASGRYVNERSAMQNATFNRAVTLISSSIGMLPTNLMARNASGNIEKATDHPAHNLLRTGGKPNSYQDVYKFKTYMQGRALIHGNAYAHVVPGVRGPQALIPLDPMKVKVRLTEQFKLEYDWTLANGGKRVFRSDQIFHLRSPWSADGICGDGLLKLLAEALGLAESADEAASRLLRNGSYVGGILRHPKNISAEAALRLRGQFEERHSGAENTGKWIVTEEGMEATPFGMTGRDAQGLENRKYQAEEVSRGTGVPRPLLMFDETSWGSGIEQLGLFYVTYCLAPWFKAWEEALGWSLLTDRERETHSFKFNEGALLRGSLEAQANFFSKALGSGGAPAFFTQNEVRDKFDMNPADRGDNLNMGANAPQENENVQT
jgi:HK97 family phage portal protein